MYTKIFCFPLAAAGLGITAFSLWELTLPPITLITVIKYPMKKKIISKKNDNSNNKKVDMF